MQCNLSSLEEHLFQIQPRLPYRRISRRHSVSARFYVIFKIALLKYATCGVQLYGLTETNAVACSIVGKV
jgi:hypothetical protein